MVGEFKDLSRKIAEINAENSNLVFSVNKKIKQQGDKRGRYSFKGDLKSFKDYINENFISKQM